MTLVKNIFRVILFCTASAPTHALRTERIEELHGDGPDQQNQQQEQSPPSSSSSSNGNPPGSPQGGFMILTPETVESLCTDSPDNSDSPACSLSCDANADTADDTEESDDTPPPPQQVGGGPAGPTPATFQSFVPQGVDEEDEVDVDLTQALGSYRTRTFCETNERHKIVRTIILLRHGESATNAQSTLEKLPLQVAQLLGVGAGLDRHLAWDPTLTSHGLQTVSTLSQHMQDYLVRSRKKVSRVAVSPLVRTHQTAAGALGFARRGSRILGADEASVSVWTSLTERARGPGNMARFHEIGDLDPDSVFGFRSAVSRLAGNMGLASIPEKTVHIARGEFNRISHGNPEWVYDGNPEWVYADLEPTRVQNEPALRAHVEGLAAFQRRLRETGNPSFRASEVFRERLSASSDQRLFFGDLHSHRTGRFLGDVIEASARMLEDMEQAIIYPRAATEETIPETLVVSSHSLANRWFFLYARDQGIIDLDALNGFDLEDLTVRKMPNASALKFDLVLRFDPAEEQVANGDRPITLTNFEWVSRGHSE